MNEESAEGRPAVLAATDPWQLVHRRRSTAPGPRFLASLVIQGSRATWEASTGAWRGWPEKVEKCAAELPDRRVRRLRAALEASRYWAAAAGAPLPDADRATLIETVGSAPVRERAWSWGVAPELAAVERELEAVVKAIGGRALG